MEKAGIECDVLPLQRCMISRMSENYKIILITITTRTTTTTTTTNSRLRARLILRIIGRMSSHRGINKYLQHTSLTHCCLSQAPAVTNEGLKVF